MDLNASSPGHTQHLQSTRRRQESSLSVGTTGPVAGRSIRPQQPQASATATWTAAAAARGEATTVRMRGVAGPSGLPGAWGASE